MKEEKEEGQLRKHFKNKTQEKNIKYQNATPPKKEIRENTNREDTETDRDRNRETDTQTDRQTGRQSVRGVSLYPRVLSSGNTRH